jgi:hypothetical protein
MCHYGERMMADNKQHTRGYPSGLYYPIQTGFATLGALALAVRAQTWREALGSRKRPQAVPKAETN